MASPTTTHTHARIQDDVAKRLARAEGHLRAVSRMWSEGKPCPAALLLIPAAIGLGAILKGLLLVVSFSLGLAVVLMAMGIVTLRASGWLERGDWTRRISIASAYFITLLGVALTVKAMLAPVVH
jgi:ABC-type nickel/cobalt efflux system permease component RcnA